MKKEIFLITLLIFISSCSSQINSQESINKGLIYLKNSHDNNLLFNDEYLKYVYPGESLECPLENCEITYRKLDSFFNLIFIKNEFNDYTILNDEVEKADKTLKSLVPIWREKKLYNIINESMIDSNGIALDTYCILGYLYEDEQMSNLVFNSLSNDRWIPQSFYEGDQDFRTMADETWCVRLITKTNNKNKISNVQSRIVQDTFSFINESHEEITKVNVAIHALTMLYENDKNNKDIKFFQDYIAKSVYEKETWKDTSTLANVLDVLVYTEYKNKAVINKLATKLISRQEKDGRFSINKGYKENFGQIFTTFRALTALNKFEKWQKST